VISSETKAIDHLTRAGMLLPPSSSSYTWNLLSPLLPLNLFTRYSMVIPFTCIIHCNASFTTQSSLLSGHGHSSPFHFHLPSWYNYGSCTAFFCSSLLVRLVRPVYIDNPLPTLANEDVKWLYCLLYNCSQLRCIHCHYNRTEHLYFYFCCHSDYLLLSSNELTVTSWEKKPENNFNHYHLCSFSNYEFHIQWLSQQAVS